MEKKLNFVLIDDDNVFNFLSQRVLNNCGIANDISVFSNAKDALSFFIDNKDIRTCDIIFLDIRMPEMDGFEFLAEFDKLNYSNIDIYMLTSSLDARDKEKAFSYSYVKGFYSKPLNKDIVNEIYNAKMNEIRTLI